MRVVVIGAGVIGSCLAYRLATSGISVVLVDSAKPAASLSAHSFSWVNPVDNGHTFYYELTLASLAAHHRLAGELAEVDAEPWLFQCGNLHWADSRADCDYLQAMAADYRRRDYPVTELDCDGVLKDLEPNLRLEDVVGPIIFYPSDVYVLSDRLLTVVQERARQLGVTIIIEDPVVGFLGDSPVRGVRLATGPLITADAVVCCAGRATSTLLNQFGAGPPLVEPDDPEVTTRGLLVRTTPVPQPVQRVVHAPRLSIRPHRAGRLVLHCHDIDKTLTADTRPEDVAETVLGRLAAVLPGTADAAVKVESAYIGVRPMPRDGMSVFGWLPGAESIYVVVTHSGVTLAPVLADIVSQEIRGEPHPLAAGFRPDRFLVP